MAKIELEGNKSILTVHDEEAAPFPLPFPLFSILSFPLFPLPSFLVKFSICISCWPLFSLQSPCLCFPSAEIIVCTSTPAIINLFEGFSVVDHCLPRNTCHVFDDTQTFSSDVWSQILMCASTLSLQHQISDSRRIRIDFCNFSPKSYSI